MTALLLNAILQLIGGCLFAFGLLGGAQANRLHVEASRTSDRIRKWTNWSLEFSEVRFGPFEALGHALFGCSVVGGIGWLFNKALGDRSNGYPWLTPSVALLLLAVASCLVTVAKLLNLAAYARVFQSVNPEIPMERSDVVVWVLSSPPITALTVSFLTLLVSRLTNWSWSHVWIYSFALQLSVSFALFFAMTIHWTFTRVLTGRVTLVLAGIAFYVAGSLVLA